MQFYFIAAVHPLYMRVIYEKHSTTSTEDCDSGNFLQIEQWLKIKIDHEEANLTKQTVVISQITQRSCNIPDGNNSFARSC